MTSNFSEGRMAKDGKDDLFLQIIRVLANMAMGCSTLLQLKCGNSSAIDSFFGVFNPPNGKIRYMLHGV